MLKNKITKMLNLCGISEPLKVCMSTVPEFAVGHRTFSDHI